MCELAFFLLVFGCLIGGIHKATTSSNKRQEADAKAAKAKAEFEANQRWLENQPGDFRVIGVDKASGFDVEQIIGASSAANAKVKAELLGVVVTSCVPLRRMEPQPAAKKGITREQGYIIFICFVAILFFIVVMVTSWGSWGSSYSSTSSPLSTNSGSTYTPPVRTVPDSSSHTQRSSYQKWYEGGTLHTATLAQWRRASARNRLATAADWAASYLMRVRRIPTSQLNMERDVRPLAEAMVREVNSVMDLDGMDNQKVSELAAAAVIMAGG